MQRRSPAGSSSPAGPAASRTAAPAGMSPLASLARERRLFFESDARDDVIHAAASGPIGAGVTCLLAWKCAHSFSKRSAHLRASALHAVRLAFHRSAQQTERPDATHALAKCVARNRFCPQADAREQRLPQPSLSPFFCNFRPSSLPPRLEVARAVSEPRGHPQAREESQKDFARGAQVFPYSNVMINFA